MKSWSARALSVRRVTQDNCGKKTAGVDGVKSLTPKQRLTLISLLKLGSKVSPTRRVWIPKPGTEEKRPLGIPTMKDRAKKSASQTGILIQNGKRVLNRTHTGSELGGHVMMPSKQFSIKSDTSLNMCWTLILRSASTVSTIKHCCKN